MDLCPITKEPIVCAIELRGAKFETAAIAQMLQHARDRATHPYERTPLTRDELARVHEQLLHTNKAFLLENGWIAQTTFVADLTPASAPQDGDGQDGDGQGGGSRRACGCSRYDAVIVCMVWCIIWGVFAAVLHF